MVLCRRLGRSAQWMSQYSRMNWLNFSTRVKLGSRRSSVEKIRNCTRPYGKWVGPITCYTLCKSIYIHSSRIFYSMYTPQYHMPLVAMKISQFWPACTQYRIMLLRALLPCTNLRKSTNCLVDQSRNLIITGDNVAFERGRMPANTTCISLAWSLVRREAATNLKVPAMKDGLGGTGSPFAFLMGLISKQASNETVASQTEGLAKWRPGQRLDSFREGRILKFALQKNIKLLTSFRIQRYKWTGQEVLLVRDPLSPQISPDRICEGRGRHAHRGALP